MIIPKFTVDKNVINNEIAVLNNILIQQRQLKQTLALYLKKISNGIYNATDTQDATSLISCLDGIQKSFDNIKENINQILDLRKYLENASTNSYDSSYFEKYNEEFIKLFEKISEDNVFYYSFMESLLKHMNVTFKTNTNIAKPTIKNTEKNNIENTHNKSTSNSASSTVKIENDLDTKKEIIINELKTSNLNERTLYVSEKKHNAVLPYSTYELEKCFSKNPEKYSSIQDIIDKEYTINIRNHHRAGLSRFKETYNLAKNKSKLSFIKSLSLAKELFFNLYVDPLVIKSCKNIDELYIFLSCLDDNILNEFNCFKIVYEF